MPSFGPGKDLRTFGANTALKDLGLDKNTVTGKARVTPTKAKTIAVSEYSTPGAYENPKVAEAIPAPNYRESAVKKRSCVTCKHYNARDGLLGLCKKFDFIAKRDYVCDAWA